MAFVYFLKEHGRTLATRPVGARLRKEVLESAEGSSTLEISLDGVLSVSHSFADEFFARLLEDAGERGLTITMSDARPEVDLVVRRALERRDLSLPVAA